MEELDVSFARVYISPGECILWRGRPQKGNLLMPQDAWAITFSILWCGFAAIQTLSLRTGQITFKPSGLPFLLAGLYLLFGRFIWRAIQRSRTVYVITNQKIIRRRMGNIEMRRHNPKLSVSVKVHRNGNGNITIGSSDSWDYKEDRRPAGGITFSFEKYPHLSKTAEAFVLENIPEPERVYRILTQK